MTHLQCSEFLSEVSAMSCWNKWFQLKWTTTTITNSHCLGPFIYELSKVLWFTFNDWRCSHTAISHQFYKWEYGLNSQSLSNGNQLPKVLCRKLLQNDDCRCERKRCYSKATKGWWPFELAKWENVHENIWIERAVLGTLTLQHLV